MTNEFGRKTAVIGDADTSALFVDLQIFKRLFVLDLNLEMEGNGH